MKYYTSYCVLSGKRSHGWYSTNVVTRWNWSFPSPPGTVMLLFMANFTLDLP